MLTHYTTGITGNLEVAREIVQEAFVRYWKSPDEKIPIESEKSWLFCVCRNMAIDTTRRAKRIISVGGSAEVESLAGLNSIYAADEKPNQDPFAGVLTALEKLSRDQQEVVRLRYQHDLSYKEIAEVTGHSVSNVGVIVHEAMKKMKTLLSSNHEVETGESSK